MKQTSPPDPRQHPAISLTQERSGSSLPAAQTAHPGPVGHSRHSSGCIWLALAISIFMIMAVLISGRDLLISANRALVGYALSNQQPLTAERLLYFSLRLQPASAELRELYGQVLYARGDYLGAAGQFQGAVQAKPDFAAARNNLGVALLALGYADQAIPHFEAAVALNPTSAQAQLNLGNAYQASGQKPQAAKAYQRAVNLNPDLAAAWVGWGGIQLEQGDLTAARQAFQQAIANQPDDALALKGLGAIAVMQEQPLNSLPYLQAASKASPRDAAIHIFLGLALEKLGRAEQALAEFQQAYALIGQGVLRDEIQLRLAQMIQQRGAQPTQ